MRTEQARERRRLCTDPALYRKACERTAGEIRRYNAVGEDARNRMDGLLARARCVLIWSSRIVKTRMSQR